VCAATSWKTDRCESVAPFSTDRCDGAFVFQTNVDSPSQWHRELLRFTRSARLAHRRIAGPIPASNEYAETAAIPRPLHDEKVLLSLPVRAPEVSLPHHPDRRSRSSWASSDNAVVG
jgi:hypothetical protein